MWALFMLLGPVTLKRVCLPQSTVSFYQASPLKARDHERALARASMRRGARVSSCDSFLKINQIACLKNISNSQYVKLVSDKKIPKISWIIINFKYYLSNKVMLQTTLAVLAISHLPIHSLDHCLKQQKRPMLCLEIL